MKELVRAIHNISAHWFKTDKSLSKEEKVLKKATVDAFKSDNLKCGGGATCNSSNDKIVVNYFIKNRFRSLLLIFKFEFQWFMSKK